MHTWAQNVSTPMALNSVPGDRSAQQVMQALAANGIQGAVNRRGSLSQAHRTPSPRAHTLPSPECRLGEGLPMDFLSLCLLCLFFLFLFVSLLPSLLGSFLARFAAQGVWLGNGQLACGGKHSAAIRDHWSLQKKEQDRRRKTNKGKQKGADNKGADNNNKPQQNEPKIDIM